MVGHHMAKKQAEERAAQRQEIHEHPPTT
jgi:hypothetical protein